MRSLARRFLAVRPHRGFWQAACQLPLAAPIVGQSQELDGDLAGLFVGKPVHENLKDPAVFLPWKQLFAIDKLKQRHRLFAQRMDDMPIIDHLVVLAAGVRTSSLERHQMRAADKDVETVVGKAHAQPVTDEP
jgi:hypothetical protein